MLVYKATDKNMQCRGFQYEIGKTYETDRAKLCECGFHGCISAVDVLKYYNPAGSRFFVAELDGVMDETGDDSKRVGTKITLLREISALELAKVAVESAFDYVEFDKKIKSSSNAGNYGTANAGYRGVANAGYRGAANAGDHGAANAGDHGAANVGDRGAANAGDLGAAKTSLNGSSSVGKSGTSVGYGKNARVRGGINSVLIIFHRENKKWIPHVAIVDGEKILPNVFYNIKNGEFVEWEESE